MRDIGHFIGGKTVKGTSGRQGDVFDPNTGEVQAKVALASKTEVAAGHRQCRGGLPGLGRDQPAAPRPGDVQVSRAGGQGIRRSRPAAVVRARQDLSRRQRRHPARPGSGRIRLRHSASAERRIHRERRPWHRSLFGAPTARRGRRHYPVQFPGDDPVMEMRAGDRLRQCLHPQAVGTRSFRADANCRTVHRGRLAARHSQCRQWRQGSGRYAADRRAASRRSASSARPISRSTFIRPARRTASACNVSAAPRTT